MSNRCRALTAKGTRCRNSSGDNGLCGMHRNWQDNGHDPFGGIRADAASRLPDYIDYIKKGFGRRAAAAHAHVAYETVMEQRSRNAEFKRLEIEAERDADGQIDCALFEQAKKGNVGAAVFWSKIRRGWSDVSRVELVNQVREAEFERVLRALEAAGVTDEQLAAAQTVLESEHAGTVH